MTHQPRDVAADFDTRAASYSQNEWHRTYAERLVTHAALAAGHRVLDAGTGTGFALLAAARQVGADGVVVGVDVSPAMLDQARAALREARLTNVELLQADACDLPQVAAASFDAVICAAALLYMPVARALGEWFRLLKPGGTIGFSTMRAGFPQAGRLFRDCAAAFGIELADPSAPLGSPSAASAALESAGFTEIAVIADRIGLSDADFSCAWESNIRSTAHAAVRALDHEELETLRNRFERALADARRNDATFPMAEVLYAYGRKPASR